MRKILWLLFMIPAGIFANETLESCTAYGSVDFSVKLREWDGFGVNYVQAARTPDYGIDAQDYGGFSFLDESSRQEIIELIFGEDGLRPGIAKMFLDPLHQKTPDSEFDHETTTKWMRYFIREGLKRIEARGETLKIITTLYGPPAWATKQKVLNGRDLDLSQKEKLADYLIDWIDWLKKVESIDIAYVSLFNEGDKPLSWPESGVVESQEIFDYNGFWPTEAIAEFMPFLRDKLNEAGLGQVGVTPGECTSWRHFNMRLYDWTIASKAEVLSSLSLITSHSFGGPDRVVPTGVRIIRDRRPEMHAWVTSSSWGRIDMHMPHQAVLNIVQMKVNGFMPWAIVQTPTQWKDGMDPNAAPPIRVSEDGTYEVTSVYYLYKQFTVAGRAGMAVVPTATTADTDCHIIGFGHDDTHYPDAFCVVNINDWAGKKMAVKISGTPAEQFQAYRTHRKYGLRPIDQFKDLGLYEVQDGYIILSVPPHSVTTFIAR